MGRTKPLNLSKTIMESMNCFDDNEEDMADRIESKKFQKTFPRITNTWSRAKEI